MIIKSLVAIYYKIPGNRCENIKIYPKPYDINWDGRPWLTRLNFPAALTVIEMVIYIKKHEV